MKRDWDLLRKQLTDIEDEVDLFAELSKKDPVWRDEQTEEEFQAEFKAHKAAENRVFQHLEMLVDNGFVDGITLTRSFDGRLGYAKHHPRLTMAGYDLLDTIRSKPVWQKVKDTAAEKGIELSFDAVKAIGGWAIKGMFGS